jgi:hypothetical protein
LTVATLLQRLAAGIAAVAGAAALAGCGSSDVTRARLEASIVPTFDNLYVQQAAILGRTGVTAASMHSHAWCDKGGPKVADHGPGADWLCTIDFVDNSGTEQAGKFEIQVKSNSCYTAGGPSKIIGLQTITDAGGHDVTNPVFEFDGCFDPDH